MISHQRVAVVVAANPAGWGGVGVGGVKAPQPPH